MLYASASRASRLRVFRKTCCTRRRRVYVFTGKRVSLDAVACVGCFSTSKLAKNTILKNPFTFSGTRRLSRSTSLDGDPLSSSRKPPMDTYIHTIPRRCLRGERLYARFARGGGGEKTCWYALPARGRRRLLLHRLVITGREARYALRARGEERG